MPYKYRSQRNIDKPIELKRCNTSLSTRAICFPLLRRMPVVCIVGVIDTPHSRNSEKGSRTELWSGLTNDRDLGNEFFGP